MNVKTRWLLVMLAVAMPFSSWALKMAGKHYQGIAKNVNGDPLELWVDLEFDDEDLSVNIGDVYSFMAPYKVTGTDSNATISIKMPGFNTPIDFKTTDGGSSLTANFDMPDRSKTIGVNLWVLKVPRKLKPTTQSEEETLETLTSDEGYTCFMEIKKNDSLWCVTADAFFTPDGKFRVVHDSPLLREMFRGSLDGTFSISGSDITLNLEGGSNNGGIYDQGNYIKVPVASNGSKKVTLILIR